MFPEIIYSWLLGILAIAGVAIIVISFILVIILVIKMLFD